MTKYIVNNKEVEYLHIEERHDGTTVVTFEEKFNIVTAHMGFIMRKLRDNNLDGVLVFKDLQHDIISILLDDINQVHGVLHALCVPHACYEVLYNDLTIVIDVPRLMHAVELENVSSDVGYAL